MDPDRKPLTLEDVQKMLGALYIEVETLRRENVTLRAKLSEHVATSELNKG